MCGLGGLLEPLRAVLKPSWCRLGVSWGAPAALWGALGTSWDGLGPSWVGDRRSWGGLDLLGRSQENHGGPLGRSQMDQKLDPKTDPKSGRIATGQMAQTVCLQWFQSLTGLNANQIVSAKQTI